MVHPGDGSASLLGDTVGGDVEDCTGGRGSARRYRPLLESVDGSALSNHD
jgi:hypothetical protein